MGTLTTTYIGLESLKGKLQELIDTADFQSEPEGNTTLRERRYAAGKRDGLAQALRLLTETQVLSSDVSKTSDSEQIPGQGQLFDPDDY